MRLTDLCYTLQRLEMLINIWTRKPEGYKQQNKIKIELGLGGTGSWQGEVAGSGEERKTKFYVS